MLRGKKIVVGITGGIAAYKTTFLVRLLVKEGAEVKVILSKEAQQFVTAQSLSVLSKNEVVVDFFDANLNWNNHVALAEWADLMLIAPLTANTLAKMAYGLCDNVLLATYLSLRTTCVVAPAMDLEMYRHITVSDNLAKIKQRGNLVIPPGTGELASGLVGEGRMAEPEEILDFLLKHLASNAPLNGKRILINAGPTYEAIDPVRFIGNRSSGKMGIELAECCARLGGAVTLVLGPSAFTPKNPLITVVHVESGKQMHAAMLQHYDNMDLVICSAAVADYAPAEVSTRKIKKTDHSLNLALIKTKDILADLGAKKKQQVLVGFALETENIEAYALEKLRKKNLDVIVANSAIEPGSGFSGDTNKITLLDKHNKITKFELKSKADVASDIVHYLVHYKA